MGEEWSSEKLNQPRYFCYWQTEPLKKLVETEGFEILNCQEENLFIKIIAKKKQEYFCRKEFDFEAIKEALKTSPIVCLTPMNSFLRQKSLRFKYPRDFL